MMIEVARSQRGVITLSQLTSIGFSRYRIGRMERDGWMREIRPGAFAVGSAKRSAWDDAIAAGLLAGPGAVLSHRTAAAIHGFRGLLIPSTPELSVPAGRNPRLPGVILHRVAHLEDCDVIRRYNLGITSPARTVVDLAGCLQDQLLGQIIDEGTISRSWTATEIRDAAERAGARGRPGQQRLRRVLASRLGERPADSMLELRILRTLAPYAPFEVHYQLVLDGLLIILDIAWPTWKVGAECDGFAVHERSRRRFDRDREAMNLLLEHGWKVVRLTSAMDDATVLRTVGALLPASAVARVGR
jgi:predicted transcriptional regulator of viral defense system/very-short-patch-repair endonuclease